MGILQRVKNIFKRGGYALTGQTINSINDHPRINIDPAELLRIERDFKLYRNDYPKIRFINSKNKVMHRDYNAINMVKMTSEMMASLVLNENAEIHVDGEAEDFIQAVFEHNDFKRNLTKYLEPMFATGGVAARPYVDTNTNKIEFSWALANSFYPLKSTSNGISEGVIVFKTMQIANNKTFYFTLLEFHEWDGKDLIITNELYKSEDSSIIGTRVNLGYMGQYEGLKDTSTLKSMSKPLFNYLKPSGFNNFSLYSPLGVGICGNALSTLKQINDTYDQFNWEIRMGQRTVAVSDAMLSYVPDESGKVLESVFDEDENIYKSFRMNQDDEFIKDLTHDIRTEQYISAINQFMKTLELQMQLSVGTFSFDGKSVKTATEVVSENSLTFRTRNMHCNEVEKFIKGLVVSVIELAKAYELYNGETPSYEQISVDFDDGIFSSMDQKLEFYSKASVANLIPKTEAIKSLFKLTDEESEQWFLKIQSEELGLDPQENEQQAANKELGDEE